ncbi:MAG: nucleoside-diphosphate kinase [Candidatus Daviesbacteria bacterium]|nr:nucleoside-diphosphate kinase [Candidatus Daviesbacteria bacterium]
MSRELCTSITTPDVFSMRSLGEQTSAALRAERMTLSDLELQKLHQVNIALKHPELIEMTKEGLITLAMIKPQANESKDLSPNDQKAADLLMDEIGRDKIIFSLSLKLSPDNVMTFYQGNPHLDSILSHFEQGSATLLLLHYKQGDAVCQWRKDIGPTDPEKASVESPDSIRGKHALSISNNLVHGSDSIESVIREIGVWRGIVAELEDKAKSTKESFPSEKCVSRLLRNPREELVAMERVYVKSNRNLPYYVAVIRNPEGIQSRILNSDRLAKAEQLVKAS